MRYTVVIEADDTRKAKTMTMQEIARTADLSNEKSMVAALNEIGKLPLTESQAMYLSCVDIDDPSQVYDALVWCGAVPTAWQDAFDK